VESQHLQECSLPHVSVKDRWVGPNEQILNVSIAYWYMGSISLVVYHQQSVILRSLLQWLPRGEKLGMNPWIGQSSCCRLDREPFFSGAVGLSIVVDDFVKGCYTWTTLDTYGREPYANRA
jgi:hypothetical protein